MIVLLKEIFNLHTELKYSVIISDPLANDQNNFKDAVNGVIKIVCSW